uniref:Protein Flattop n=1 Tax=Periophthalmus magnuspinnatus TaxID=409849 RepID=A0A3B4AJT7_9GOBI
IYFSCHRMQNWCQTKHFKERPSAKQGHTSFIVDDRGHLLPSNKVKLKHVSWSDFKGTWELPSRIPAPSVCPTARSQQGLNRLKAWGFIESLPNMTPTPGGGRHTEGNTDKVPLRPIVCSVDSITYNVAKHLKTILTPLVGNTEHHIENTAEQFEQEALASFPGTPPTHWF